MGTRVNSASISATGTTASAYSTTLGVAALAGDLLVVAGSSNGTHAANGMSVKDSVNGTNFTTVLEEDLSNSSTKWQQAFVFRTPVDLPSGTTITFTPYALNTLSSFALDIFRGYTDVAVVTPTTADVLATTANAPAFAGAPAAGSLVLTFVAASSSSLAVSAPYTIGSSILTNIATGVGYVLGADGSSTYASTWTLSGSVSNADIDAAYTGAATAPSHPAHAYGSN